MSKKYQKNVERQLIDIVNSRSNENKCGECGSAYPTWASWNIGILLCGRCASIHRRVLGDEVSKVKSLTLDQWTEDQIDNLRRIGNKKAKRKWNLTREPFPFDDDDDGPIEEFFKNKYLYKSFRGDKFDFSEPRSRFNGFSDDGSVTPGSSNRLRSNSMRQAGAFSRGSTGSLPRLSHRELTSYEQLRFPNQVRKIMSFGYTDRDLVLEALLLSDGSLDMALSILDYDSVSNPQREEIPPALPKRPQSGTTQFLGNNPMNSLLQNQDKPAETQSTSDWWSNSNQSSVLNTGTGQITPLASQPPTQLQQLQPQIYQYTDPTTGQISYIDSNGQQYMDTNAPQYQQMLLQQQNPQLVAQQTSKQSILSLYNQPQQPQQQQSQQQPQQLQQPNATGMGNTNQASAPVQQIQQVQQVPQQIQQIPQQIQQIPQQTGFSGFQYQPTGYSQFSMGQYQQNH